MNLKVEYLVIVDKASSSALFSLCENEKELIKLLSKDSPISNIKNKIRFENIDIASYKINTALITGKDQRYFYLSFEFNGEENDLEIFSRMLHTARVIITNAGGQIETLWDDISLFYSKIAYEEIHKIENLMRKLITYFMITNIGKDWVDETSPSSVKETISKSKRDQYIDILYQIDFIHLGDFLFKTYQSGNINELFDKISNAKKIDDLQLTELKDFVIKSNWDRFFSKVVDCDDTYLKKRWEELYDYRCKVAHNSIIRKDDLERIRVLVKEVGDKLQSAINNIQKIEISEDEREKVAENVASSVNQTVGEFIYYWRLLEKYLESSSDKNAPYKNLYEQLIKLFGEYLSQNELTEYRNLFDFRNYIVHGHQLNFDTELTRSYTEKIKDILNELNVSWKDEVVNTLKALGGRATLSDIYSYIEKHTRRKLSPTWQATVRRTLQQHSSDTETYRGGEDLFKHIESGVYELRK